MENKILWPGWETVRLIGRGSYGAVYEIERELYEGEKEKAALKVISIPHNESEVNALRIEGLDDQSITRIFEGQSKEVIKEYAMMRKLSGHTNIVNCQEFRHVQQENGLGWDVFIRMELLEPFTSVLGSVIEEKQVVAVGKDLCQALILCRKYSIVHRDIKPQNIFVSDTGDYKLGDFGIARTMEQTSGATSIGTPNYMAPEVAKGLDYGNKADIYSLGLVLYWMLNERRLPFLPLPPKLTTHLDNKTALNRRLSGEPIPEPKTGSKALKAIVLKACAYEPKYRYTTADEMLAALNALSTESVITPPQPEKPVIGKDTIIKQDPTQDDAIIKEPWSFDEATGTLIIRGEVPIEASEDTGGHSVFPWEEHQKNIRRVIIKEGVVIIWSYAFFGCSNLESVVIPDSVTCIGYLAFAGCSSLTEIVLPDGITSINNQMFSGCSKLKRIMIPDGVTSIGGWAFDSCSSLTEIVIPDNVTSIDVRAFSRCSNLESIVIPNSVTSIGDFAFYGCNSLTEIVMPDSVTSIGMSAFDSCINLREIVLPDGITSIENDVFSGCRNLESIIIPCSVTSIGKHAFSYCRSLKNIYYAGNEAQWNAISFGEDAIPDDVTILFALKNTAADNLTSFFDEATGTLTFWGEGPIKIYDLTDGSGIIEKIRRVIIKEGAVSVEAYTFEDCRNLKSIEIPDSVTSIGEGAFSGCSSLTEIVIPDSVTSIGEFVFYGCNSLESIAIPDSVTSIAGRAFSRCSNLESIVIPNSVTSIGESAFSGCSSLSSIVIPNSVTSIGEFVFSGCNSLESIAIPDSVTSIDECAFEDCRNLKSIEIPNSVTNIGASAFFDCSSLVSIVIPDSVTSIGEFAFSGCSSLESIVIPDSITSIGESVFCCCFNLEDIYYAGNEAQWSAISFGEDAIPDDVTILFALKNTAADNLTSFFDEATGTLIIRGEVPIEASENTGGHSVFPWEEHRKNIRRVIIKEGVVSIGSSAFSGCSNLESVVIPDSVTSIGGAVFSRCSNLESIVIPDGVTRIGAWAFDSCSSLTEIVIPDSVTSIGDGAFIECRSLRSIVIPYGVTSISRRAFEYCRNLKSIEIPNSVTSIGEYAFYGCSSLTEIVIPDSVTSIGGWVFRCCDSLKNIYYLGNEAQWNAISFGAVAIPDNVNIHFERQGEKYE